MLQFPNDKVYVGQTIKTLEKRAAEHLSNSRREKKLPVHHAINKYGINVILLEECSKDILDEREKYWIKLKKSNNRKFGYNITNGGSGNVGGFLNHPYREKIRNKLKNKIPHNKYNLDIDQIKKMYIEDKMSVKKIAEYYNVSQCVIANRLILSDISIRSVGYYNAGKIPHNKINVDYNKVMKLYYTENMSQKQIGIIFNCSHHVISRILRGLR